MPPTTRVQPPHLQRNAVISVRQSTGHQVLTNTASLQLPHAMRDPAPQRGWRDEPIEVVATDLGRAAQRTAGRDGSNTLLAEVAWGHVGLVRSDERTRRSRHGTEWSPWLDLGPYQQCLSADRDGV
jgi:hypothetical protein